MTGKDLKRMMRKDGVTVAMLARWLDSSETHVKRLQAGDSDTFYFDTKDKWRRRVKNAAGYAAGSVWSCP